MKSYVARLADIVEAADLISTEMAGVTLEALDGDLRLRWLVERGLEIISEASRRLPTEIKARHDHIPWSQVAGIGNVLRHDYERIAYDVLWRLVQNDLPPLRMVCSVELSARVSDQMTSVDRGDAKGP